MGMVDGRRGGTGHTVVCHARMVVRMRMGQILMRLGKHGELGVVILHLLHRLHGQFAFVLLGLGGQFAIPRLDAIFLHSQWSIYLQKIER